VGAGQAGAYAAVAMREAGFAGRILLIGDEKERPYERPPLSKDALTGPPAPPAYFHKEARYTDLGIELLLGTAVTAIDPVARQVALADGRRLGFTRLLLATGGRARALRVRGAGDVLTLRTLADAGRIRAALQPGRRVACIGAGVIGLEVASSAKARGCVVDVIEAGPSVMGRCVGPEIASWMARLHETNGVTLHLGAAVEAVEAGRVVFGGGREIAADCVIAGVGMERNVELAAAAGLQVDGGIVVDAFGRSSAEGIYAAGDVAAFWAPRLGRHVRLESWKHAQDHGIAVGRAMADAGSPYEEIPWFWTDQHGVNLQMAGTPEGAAVTVVRGDPQASRFSAWQLDAEDRPIGVAGVNAPRDVRAGLAFMRAGRRVDRAALADPSKPLRP
jgi:NADPH-dependent 2,4-dienoyl-CoA reductase/sulfur reductase-like enzyme